MFDDVGSPRHERARTGEPVLSESQEQFAEAIGSLTQGELTFPAPFDLVSSWALARNANEGDAALESFARDTNSGSRRFQIRIHALSGEDSRREIIDTVVTGPRVAAQLLAGLAIDMVNGEDHNFQIRVHELPPDNQSGNFERELVDTVVAGPRVAAQILRSLASEMVDIFDD